MFEQLAGAIISGLIKGSTTAATQMVADAYTSAREALGRLVPRFNADEVSPNNKAISEKELVTRLQGNTDEENAELAKVFAKLAAALGETGDNEVFERVVHVKGVSAAYDVNVDIKSGRGSHDSIEDIESKAGSISISTEQITRDV